MCTTVDLFGNTIKQATPQKKVAQIISTPPVSQPEPTKFASVSVENYSISPNYISTYETYIDANTNSISTYEYNFLDNHHDCKMSPSAVKTIKKCTQLIGYLSRNQYFNQLKKEKQKAAHVGCTTKRCAAIQLEAAQEAKYKHLVTFVTLTLPSEQRHTDNELCKHVLNPFLVYARKYWKIRYYIWKKELQSNGNLHFHLIFDRTVPWQSIRKEWNKLLNQGAVKGCEVPFDYVDRYHDKWSKIHENGFNREYVTKYVATLPSTADTIKERMDAWQEETGEMFSTQDYNNLRHDIIEAETAKYYRAYKKEIQKPITEWWRDPNDTDIHGVNSPNEMAAYLSKYIAKDIENNPALAQYDFNVEQYKREMDEWRRTAIYNKLHDIDDTDALECWRRNLAALNEYRAKYCPIQGRMWFKSKSLTVFLKGAKGEIEHEYYDELIDLENYLHTEEKRINEQRAIRAQRARERGDMKAYERLSKPISLVLSRYDTHPDGSPNLDKVICKTLLINIFDLQHLKTDKGKARFPLLSCQWWQFIHKGIEYNKQNGLYEKD